MTHYAIGARSHTVREHIDRGRAVPRVRRWIVRYYLDKILLAEITVDAVNRTFARWAARDRFRAVHLARYLAANRETVSAVRQ